MNVLWSKQSFPGNWQLTATDERYAFFAEVMAVAEQAWSRLSPMDLPVTFDDTTVDHY